MVLRTTLFCLYISLNLYSYEPLTQGIWYLHDTSHAAHILKVDPEQATITIGVADAICAASETTSTLAREYGALAAINAGFFDYGTHYTFEKKFIGFLDLFGYRGYKAFPVFALQVDGIPFSVSHKETGAIGWNTQTQKPLFAAITSRIELTIDEKPYPVNTFNRPHTKGPTLYSSVYDTKTPSAPRGTIEVILLDNKVHKIYRNARGRSSIPKHGWVYSIPRSSHHIAATLHEGDTVSITATYTPTPGDTRWNSVDTILGGTPLLLTQGNIVPYVRERTSSYYLQRHPRTAVGLLEDGSWVFVVVDGRSSVRPGFTMIELAEYMLQLGCIEALNLDGGGSSTMVIRDTIVNQPSGSEYAVLRRERALSNALLVVPKS